VTGNTSGVAGRTAKGYGRCPGAKEQLDAATKALRTVVLTFSNKVPCLARTWIRPQSALAQASLKYELAKRHLDARTRGPPQELKGLQGQLSSAKGSTRAAAAQLSYSEIRSPLNGRGGPIARYTRARMEMPERLLMPIMDISRVTARAHIPQKRRCLLKVGDHAMIAISRAGGTR